MPADLDYAIVMTTTDDPNEAATLARRLVEDRLAACVQAIPVSSTYQWEGDVTNSNEVLLLVKTRADKVDDVQAFLAANHSYDTPEIVEVPITSGLPAYLAWIDESVG